MTAASTFPSLSARKTSSKRWQGTTSTSSPRSCCTATWLNAPFSPWKATVFGRFGALDGFITLGLYRGPVPAMSIFVRESKQIEDAVHAVVHQILDRLWIVVEAG